MEMGEIVIQNVNQVYHNVNQGDFNALSDINLHLCKGESLAIEGESGSGKSTLLRWVLKFAVFNAGTVLVYLLLFALLGPAVLDELLADGVGMLAALLAAGNLSFWLCDRALAALTRYYHVILKPKLKKKF